MSGPMLWGIWIGSMIIGGWSMKRSGYSTTIALLGVMLLQPFSILLIFVSPRELPCPKCQKRVDKKASICPYCRSELTPK